MSNHTPGPWKASRTASSGAVASIEIRAANEEIGYVGTFSRVLPNDYSHDFEADEIATRRHEANARLIAAAPQMLEALKHLTGFIADLRNVYSNDAAEFIMNKPSYKAAADAIKLAEGE